MHVNGYEHVCNLLCKKQNSHKTHMFYLITLCVVFQQKFMPLDFKALSNVYNFSIKHH